MKKIVLFALLGIVLASKVGPTVAEDIKTNAYWAVLGAMLIVGLYLVISFRKWQYSLGAIAAVCRGRREDVVAMFLSTLGISVPGFVIGATLIFVFAIELRVLPVGLWESPWHVVLPAVTLAFSPAAYLARLTRASVLEIVEKDWVRTARSKGLSQWSTVTKHILRNSLIPVITVLGPLTAIVITGSFVVEYIYAIPGMGRFFITAVMNRDYDLILGTTLVFAVLLIVANTFVDVAYQILDPRMRLED